MTCGSDLRLSQEETETGLRPSFLETYQGLQEDAPQTGYYHLMLCEPRMQALRPQKPGQFADSQGVWP